MPPLRRRTSQVACSSPTNSALGGRAVRAAPPPSHLPPLHAEVFYGPDSRYRRGCSPWRLSSSRPRPPPRHAGGDRRPRIVSLSPTATEDLFAIGAGKQVVAVDDQSNYPANAPRRSSPATRRTPRRSPATSPISSSSRSTANHIVEALGKLKIPVLVEPTGVEPRRRLRARSRSSASATGHAAQAAAVVARMKAQIATIVASVPHGARGSPSTTSSSPTSTRPPRRRSSAGSTRCSG